MRISDSVKTAVIGMRLPLLLVLFLDASIAAAQGDNSSAGARPETGSTCDSVLLSGVKEALTEEEWSAIISEIARNSKTPVSALGSAEAVGGALAAGGIALDTIYATLMRYAVRVRFTSPEGQTAHFGPVGNHPAVLGEPGSAIRFTVQVSMNIALSEAAISCAAAVGYKIPKPGPIADVPVLWSGSSVANDLDYYGTVTYDPANKKTNEQGESTLILTPRSELDWWGAFGVGKEVVRSRTLLADPLVLTGLNDSSVFKLGNVPQLFWGVTTEWNVAYHKPRGFKFDQVHFQTRRRDGYTNDWWISGSVCASSPWSDFQGGPETSTNPWIMKSHIDATFKSWHYSSPERKYFAGMLQAENGYTQDIGSAGRLTFMLQPRYPPKMAIEMLPWFGYPLTTPSVVTVPIVEDLSCPDNDR